MFNWKEIDDNPVSALVHRALLKHLNTLLKNYSQPSKLDFFAEQAKEKKVLDIGVVEHTLEFVEKPEWKHKKIKQVSKYALGVDILEHEVNVLKDRGFDVECVDATSDRYLGQKFDVVIIGDVIEHVNDPVKLVVFAKRHLNKGGKIIISTPNPFFIKYVYRAIKEGVFIANAEHTFWITPTNMLEICRRANCSLDSFFTIKHTGFKGIQKSVSLINRLCRQLFLVFFPKAQDFFSPDFIYVLK